MSPEQLHQSRVRRVRIDGIRPKTRTFDLKGAKIAIVGLDREGLSLAIRAASHGFETVGFDADEVKVAQLAYSEAAILDPEEAEQFKRAKKLSMSADETDLDGKDIFILCSPAAALEGTAALVAGHLKERALVIVASIVDPGTCEHVLLPIIEKGSGLERPRQGMTGGEFFFAHVPMRSGRETRAVGALDDESLSCTTAFYEELFNAPVIAMHSVKEAEAVPLVENAFQDVDRALADELAIEFDRMGVDLVHIIEAVSSRTSTLLPLPGVTEQQEVAKLFYRTRSGHEHEMEQQLLVGARRAIARMPEYAIKVLSDALRETHRTLKGTRVALLGLARMKDDPDTEGSSALKIRDSLIKKGATVEAFDPFVPNAGRDLKSTLMGARAALIATDHSVFRNLTPRHFEEFGVSLVIDARNCLDKSLFNNSPVAYRGIGRGA